MKKNTNSTKSNLDKKFLAQLTTVLKEQSNKVDAQYLCSAPSAPVRQGKN